MPSFENAGLLRTHSYTADLFNEVVLNTDDFIGSTPGSDWPTPASLYNPEGETVDGRAYYCVEFDKTLQVNRKISTKIGLFYVRCSQKTGYFEFTMYWMPKVVFIKDNEFTCIEAPDGSQVLRILSWKSTDTPETYAVSISKTDAGFSVNLTEVADTAAIPDVNGRHYIFTVKTGSTQFLKIYNSFDIIANMNNRSRYNLRMKYSLEQPYSPEKNLLWLYPYK